MIVDVCGGGGVVVVVFPSIVLIGGAADGGVGINVVDVVGEAVLVLVMLMWLINVVVVIFPLCVLFSFLVCDLSFHSIIRCL